MSNSNGLTPEDFLRASVRKLREAYKAAPIASATSIKLSHEVDAAEQALIDYVHKREAEMAPAQPKRY